MKKSATIVSAQVKESLLVAVIFALIVTVSVLFI
jgi:hypothetical protein